MVIRLEGPPGRSEGPAPAPEDAASAATHLRNPRREGIERFGATDPAIDISRNKVVRRILKNRRFQFSLIVPNQVIFWIVIFSGIFGTLVPGRNFGTAITWFIWFFLVFVLMIGVGRGWCAMCPFGGFAEWVQRRTFFRRTTKALGLGWRLPASWAGYGLVISAGAFILLTWIEEFFNIAGPGTPILTSYMVLGIVGVALVTFLLFERRTFCRYLCPLSSLIGTVGAVGMVAGFRTRDRDVCLSCQTKDCMRGGDNGYGCPWYTWPGSADSNLLCGLCSECYKACPHDNVGLFLQPPLTSVIAPARRRLDVAWVVAALFGLVIFQQANALAPYATLNSWLDRVTHFPGYPNPIDYLGIIAVVAAVLAGAASALRRTAAIQVPSAPGTSAGAPALADLARVGGAETLAMAVFPGSLTNAGRPAKTSAPASSWRGWFMPLMYGLVPVMGADYLARQLPKFFDHALNIVPSIVGPFGFRSSLYGRHLLSAPWVVRVQLLVMVAGTAASLYAMWRISGRDLAPLARRPLLARLGASTIVLGCGIAALVLYVAMHGAE